MNSFTKSSTPHNLSLSTSLERDCRAFYRHHPLPPLSTTRPSTDTSRFQTTLTMITVAHHPHLRTSRPVVTATVSGIEIAASALLRPYFKAIYEPRTCAYFCISGGEEDLCRRFGAAMKFLCAACVLRSRRSYADVHGRPITGVYSPMTDYHIFGYLHPESLTHSP